MYHYDFFNLIYYSVVADPYNILSDSVKNEEDFVKATYADVFNYQFLRSEKILINNVVWSEFNYRDENMIINYYVKKVEDVCYVCSVAYKNYEGNQNLQQALQKYINNFILYVLNNLVFDENLTIVDNDKSGISKLREIPKPAISQLESYFERMKNPNKKQEFL